MQPLKIDKPIRLIELFAGIGSQAKALKLLNANFEHYRICEFDKYAIKSYNAIHGTNFETSDITKITAEDLGIVDTDKYCYIMTYSFPCQDLSLAGKQKGMAKGENTRSGLLWEVERLLNECTELPQILLMENVTQVHGKKNIEHFNEWIAFLESKGYRNYWKDLNAKNFCIPQNRNRTFMVSILGNYTYEFPQEFPLKKRLKDMLEDSVEEKFYLSEKMLSFFIENTKKQAEKGNGFKFAPTNGDVVAKAVTTRAGGRMDDNFIEEQPTLIDVSSPKHNNRVVEFAKEVANSGILETESAEIYSYDGYNNKINKSDCMGTVVPQNSRWGLTNGYKIIEVEPNNKTIENCYVSEKGVRFICSPKRGMATDVNADICQPLTAKGQANWTGSFISPDIESLEKSSTIGSTEPTKINLKNGETITSNDNLSSLRIRKLTPKECWRLMGFQDEDFEKAAQHNSNSQLYKQAGNSICVSVLYYIFKEMLGDNQ